MANRRRFGEDYSYGEAHRDWLPKLYTRVGHRLDLADRDWTEFCHYCKQPLELYELVRNVGQNLADKGVSVTRQLARASRLPAKLLAYRVDRPPEIEVRIRDLQRQVIELQTCYPIDKFEVRCLYPFPVYGQQWKFELSPNDWWEWVALIHTTHWLDCWAAKQTLDYMPNADRIRDRLARHPLGGSLFLPLEISGYTGDGRRNGRIHV